MRAPKAFGVYRLKICPARNQSIVPGSNRGDYVLKELFVHFDEVARLREAACFDVGDVFAEGGDAFALEAAVFVEEVAVCVGVAREAMVASAEDVVRAESGGVAA